MNKSRFTVNHVRLTADRPFAEVKAAFERRLGRFDPEVQKPLAEEGDVQAARARIEAMVGPSGFMLFGTSDHGSLLRIVSRPRKAVQYVVGNPLYAVEMTWHSIGAALYSRANPQQESVRRIRVGDVAEGRSVHRSRQRGGCHGRFLREPPCP
jgi:hypothetical protein